MSRSYISIVAIALASCMFAGAADAIPLSRGEEISRLLMPPAPEPEMRASRPVQTQFGSLPALFSPPFQYSSWFGAADRVLVLVGLRTAYYFGGFGEEFGRQPYESAVGFLREGRNLIIFIWSDYRPEHERKPTGTGGGSSGQSDTPAPTPLPAPLILFGSGLGLVSLFAQRRRKRAAVPA